MNTSAVKQAAERYREYILPPYDAMMDMDGFDAICAFSHTFSGTSVYVPRLRTIFCECLEQDILRLYNGNNVRELVQRYGFSERYIRNLVRREKCT